MKAPLALDFSQLKKGMVIGPEHRQFRLIKPVSNSPIGQVWHADDLATATEKERPTKAALEILNPKLLEDSHTLDGFKSLVTQAKQLQHKHIAQIYGYFQSREGWVFVAMEAVATRSLARILMEDGYEQLNAQKCRVILGQIAQAVDIGPRHKLSHGDLTPWNVIITPESGVKLVNFAFRQPLLQKIQADGARVLNNEYHPPEAFISVPMAVSADVYTLACIAYQLFSGYPPFAQETPVDDRNADNLPAPPKLSAEQWRILRPALSQEPAERPATATKLIDALFKASSTSSTEANAEPSASSHSKATKPSTLDIDLVDNPIPASEGGSGFGKRLLTLFSTLMVFALGAVVGYLFANHQWQKQNEQLAFALAEVHRILDERPTPTNKIALRRYFAEVEHLSSNTALVEALKLKTEQYKVRTQKSSLITNAIPGSPADKAGTAPTAKPDSTDSAFIPGSVFKDEVLTDVFGPNMVVLPAGTFLMGDQDRSGDDNERPVHPVKIGRPFALSQHEVTFADYDLFALNTGRPLPNDEGWGRGDRPVINISWNDASAYAYWLSKQTGLNYRLPSEAEWEYAARAGTDTPFWWGNDLDKGKANCDECGSRWDGEKTAPVGSFKPNPFGLYDMNGNVYEWVSDCYHDNYIEAPADGSSWEVGICSNRVMRGGSWYDIGRLARSASRYRHPPNASRNSWGFRVALDLD